MTFKKYKNKETGEEIEIIEHSNRSQVKIYPKIKGKFSRVSSKIIYKNELLKNFEEIKNND